MPYCFWYRLVITKNAVGWEGRPTYLCCDSVSHSMEGAYLCYYSVCHSTKASDTNMHAAVVAACVLTTISPSELFHSAKVWDSYMYVSKSHGIPKNPVCCDSLFIPQQEIIVKNMIFSGQGMRQVKVAFWVVCYDILLFTL